MFTNNNDVDITIQFCIKMMSCEKGKFPYSFFILLILKFVQVIKSSIA